MPNYNNNKNKSGNFNVIKTDENINYINPYNFITLNKNGCKREKKEDRQGDLTGYIECTLTTKTETIVPDTENFEKELLTNGKDEFYTYSFYNYGEEKNGFKVPVIPGSELRGMLRSDFEVFTDSCMSTVNTEKSFISRTKDAKKPGILIKDENENWHLYEAVRYALHTTRRNIGRPVAATNNSEAIYMVDSFNKIKKSENKGILTDNVEEYKTGDKVRFNFYQGRSDRGIATNYVKEITEKGNEEGILFIGELGAKKDRNSIHDSIFKKQKEITKVSNLNECVYKLKEIFDMYNDKAFNKNLKNNSIWYGGYNIDKIKEIPVWYSELDNLNRTYLSLASIGKEAYHRTLSELLDVAEDKSKSYMPCIDSNNLCKACELFGFTSSTDAKGTKIRVSDATYVGDTNPYSSKRILKELASPHIANAAFYSLYLTNEDLIKLKQNVDWNYDFKFVGTDKYVINPEEISIRGRKMYWHHKPGENSKTKDKTVRNCAVIPIKEGASFKFKIYFENVKETYLYDLISVINLNYKSDLQLNGTPYYDLCHKIGKAKPLGYGSIKLHVDDVKIRDFNISNDGVCYKIVNIDEYKGMKGVIDSISLNNTFDMNSESMKEALRIYNFNYLSDNYPDCEVTYPKAEHTKRNGDTELASHYWFMDSKSQSINNPYLLISLPRICEGNEKVLNHNGLNGKVIRAGRTVEINGLKLPKFIKK